MRQTDFSNDEAVGYLADRLNRLGVEIELAKAGAEARRRDHRRRRHLRLGAHAAGRHAHRRGDRRPGRPRHRRPLETQRPARAPTSGWRPRRRRRTPYELSSRMDRRTDPLGRRPVSPGRRSPAPTGSWSRSGPPSLTTLPGGLDAARLHALVDVLAALRAAGREVVLVSSGAIAAGLAPLGLGGRPRDLATAQAAASVGQLRLVQTYADAFARHGITVGQVLLTADDLTRRGHYRNARQTVDRLLALGVLPIVNENDTVATEEIRFGDNDRLAALVAHVAVADALVLLSDVDGVYDGDPRVGPAALDRHRARRPRTSRRSCSARRPATGSAPAAWPPRSRPRSSPRRPGCPSSSPRPRRPPRRWPGSRSARCSPPRAGGPRPGSSGCATPAARAAGCCWTTARCAAVREPRRLAAGRRITGVAGDFLADDPVELVGPDGAVVARGLVAYDAREMPAAARPQDRRPGPRAPPRGRAPRRDGAGPARRVGA